jgi:sugar lactone lactonase YvrE
MSMPACARGSFAAAVVVLMAMQGSQAQDVAPVNGGANPYRVIPDWAQLTLEGRPWGGSNGVAIDRDGKSVWATDRCSPGTAPGCLGTKANPVHLFDPSGKEVRSFGGGMFVWPHSVHIDRDGNVWVTDSRTASPEELTKYPGEDKKGSIVVKSAPKARC